MKSLHRFCLSLACLFLLGACANIQRNTYINLDGDVIAPGKDNRPSVAITMYNGSSIPSLWLEVLMDNNIFTPETLGEVNDTTYYQVLRPRKEITAIMACWWEERDQKSIKRSAIITRQTLSAGPIQVLVTDALLYGKESQVGIWVNMKTKTVECWDNAGNRAVLMPGEGFRVIKNTGDRVKVYCQEIGKQRVQTYGGGILRAKDQQHYEFNGHLYDWNVEID